MAMRLGAAGSNAWKGDGRNQAGLDRPVRPRHRASRAGCCERSKPPPAKQGVRTLRLDTNRALTEAHALYRSEGYREIARFNDNPYADHWFEKRL